MKKLLLFLVLCLILPRVTLAEPQSAPLPSMNMTGLTDCLDKYKGKVLILNFFATWCPPCRAEIPELVKANKEFTAENIQIIGLSMDEDTKPVGPFVSRLGVDYPVYIAGNDVAAAYRVNGIPHNVIYARDGTLVISEPGVVTAESLKKVIEILLEQK